MVVCEPVAVVDRLLRMELETTVELITVVLNDAAVEVLEWTLDTEAVLVALPEVTVSDLVAVADALPLAEDEDEDEDEAPPPVMWKGKPYWKTSAFDSSVIMMP